MKKKIKIKINGKSNIIDDKTKLSVLVKNLKVPLRKVAIELNKEIMNKKKLNKIYLKKNDKIEIVHFIGGG
tara:strand:- start:2464 stop:2676 length:213 start_codon:yes stop_codon:yes gene_type:complete